MNEALLPDLQPFAGTDATPILRSENAPAALHQLLKHENVVIAKLETKRQITAEELHEHNHIPTADDRSSNEPPKNSSWRVWISVDTSDTALNHQTVYDVTRTCHKFTS